MAFLFDTGIFSIVGLDGDILPGAQLWWYASGTDTPLATYSDVNETAPNPNPVLANAGGRFPPIYLQPKSYKMVLMSPPDAEHPDGVTLVTRDPVSSSVLLGTSGITVENQSGTGNVVVIPNADAYSGIGTATMGAPRTTWGTNPITDEDDACFGIYRNIVGTSLFSHAVHDASTFQSNLDSGYASFDSIPEIKTNSGAKYNHSYGFQWRGNLNAANGINRFSGFQSACILTQGNADTLFHYHVNQPEFNGGSTDFQAGFFCDILTGGAGTNWAFFAQGNDSALLGNLQIQGAITGATNITASGQFAASDGTFTGPLVEYLTGGVAIAGERYTAGYGSVEGYEDNTGAPRGLVLNGNGGQVVIAKGGPVTGAKLEVGGSFSCDGPVGFNGTTPPNKPTITGSRGGNAALQNLLLALAGMGLLTDSTS